MKAPEREPKAPEREPTRRDTTSAPHPYDYAEQPLPLYGKFVVALAFPVVLVPLALLRLILVIILALLLLLLCMLFSRWRFIFQPIVSGLGRLFLLCFGVWPGMLSYRKPKSTEKAPVIALAPHLGGLEAFVMMYDGLPRAIAKEAYTRIPILSSVFRASGGIAVPVAAANDEVKRERRKKAKKVLPKTDGDEENQAEQRKEKPSHGVRQAIVAHKRSFNPSIPSLAIPVCILPEGTTHNGVSLIKFFSGAFEGGGSVQPVLLSYPHTYFNAAFFGRSLGDHLMRLLLNPWQFVRVVYLDVYHPSDAEAADPKLYAENVRRKMAEVGKLHCSEYDAKQLQAEYIGARSQACSSH